MLTTPRLRLRPVTASDVDPLCKQWNEPGVRRFLWDDAHVSRDVSAAQVEQSALDFETQGFGLWRVDTEHTECVGFMGLREAPWRDGVELLFAFSQAHWGYGYATEAGRAVLQYALVELELAEVVAASNPANRASLRVLEKIGMVPVGQTTFAGESLAVFVARSG